MSRELERFLAHRTGFKPGSMRVTCPNCGHMVRAKFCRGCGHEVTAMSYEVIQQALQRGDITHDEFLEGLNSVSGFEEKSHKMQELYASIKSGKRQLLGE